MGVAFVWMLLITGLGRRDCQRLQVRSTPSLRDGNHLTPDILVADSLFPTHPNVFLSMFLELFVNCQQPLYHP